jgi:hypothetical protein
VPIRKVPFKLRFLVDYGNLTTKERSFIDPEVQGLVKDLNAHGYTTIGSCAGHVGSPEFEGGRPTPGQGYVNIKNNVPSTEPGKGEYIRTLRKICTNHGCRGLEIEDNREIYTVGADNRERYGSGSSVRFKPMGQPWDKWEKVEQSRMLDNYYTTHNTPETYDNDTGFTRATYVQRRGTVNRFRGLDPSRKMLIDPEVRGLVNDLNRKGFKTQGSCAGHKGSGVCTRERPGGIKEDQGHIAFAERLVPPKRETVKRICDRYGCKDIWFNEGNTSTNVLFKQMGQPWDLWQDKRPYGYWWKYYNQKRDINRPSRVQLGCMVRNSQDNDEDIVGFTKGKYRGEKVTGKKKKQKKKDPFEGMDFIGVFGLPIARYAYDVIDKEEKKPKGKKDELYI